MLGFLNNLTNKQEKKITPYEQMIKERTNYNKLPKEKQELIDNKIKAIREMTEKAENIFYKGPEITYNEHLTTNK